MELKTATKSCLLKQEPLHVQWLQVLKELWPEVMKGPCTSVAKGAVFCGVRGALSGSVTGAEPDGGRSKQVAVEALRHGGTVIRGPSSTSRVFHPFSSLALTPSLPSLPPLLFHFPTMHQHSPDPMTPTYMLAGFNGYEFCKITGLNT
jgi:hypothetical protein